AITGASRGTPGLLTTVRTPSGSAKPSASKKISTPTPRSPATPSGCPESTPTTSSPRPASIRATACPERANPTTRHGPSGRGGRAFLGGGALTRPIFDLGGGGPVYRGCIGSASSPSSTLGHKPPQLGDEEIRAVDGNQREAVIDFNQPGIWEGLGETGAVLGR